MIRFNTRISERIAFSLAVPAVATGRWAQEWLSESLSSSGVI